MLGVLTPADETASKRYSVPAAFLHKLRTHLNHIIGYSELLLEQAQEKGQSGFIPDLRKVRSAGGEMLAFIDNNCSPLNLAVPAAATSLPYAATTTVFEEPAAIQRAAEMTQEVVLVVDDDAANRDVLARRLIGEGYTVLTAENGRIALEMVQETNFDLVLLDIMMPEVDGFEVLERIKSDKLLKHIPVIMISAAGETASAIRCIEMGAEDYLPKPFDPILLKARTVACLERQRANEHRRQAAVLNERNRIAQEVHDTLAQGFTGILFQLQAAEYAPELDQARAHIDKARDVAHAGLLEARRSLLLLHPQALESGKLPSDPTHLVPHVNSAEPIGAQTLLTVSPGSVTTVAVTIAVAPITA
jgi:DNA-binding response OmpR family regulator